MFNQVSETSKTSSGPAKVYFLEWLDRYVLTPDTAGRAERVFQHLVASASPLKRLLTTPQTPPYHAEADMVAGHVKRMLAGLDALEHGASLGEIEELAREKDYVLEIFELENLLKTHAAFFTAYAVCHDLGKADTVAFDAQPESLGAHEGFAKDQARLASEPEISRYDKLRRAHAAKTLAVSFFEAYGITVHYPDHARLSALDEYASTREAVLDALGVPHAHAKLLTELIRCHLEVIKTCTLGADPIKYKAWAAIAERAGLNVPVFLDLLPAALFLDAVLGSLVLENGVTRVDTRLILNLYKAEREAMPERHAAREQALKRGRKAALNEALSTAKIDAESVFALLKTPYGPVRGEVMARIHHLIHDPNSPADFGEHTVELRRRARVAQKLISEQNLSIDHLKI